MELVHIASWLHDQRNAAQLEVLRLGSGVVSGLPFGVAILQLWCVEILKPPKRFHFSVHAYDFGFWADDQNAEG